MIVETLWLNLPYLLEGAGVTVLLAVALLAIGIVVGLALALAQVYGRLGLPLLATLVERLFRGIPAIVLLFLFYYGISIFYDIGAFPAAALALGLRSAAYQSQIFRGAILSIPSGQMAAARAIGMSGAMAVASIILPQAFRQAIGPWGNEALSELKDTSLAYTIGVVELMRQASYLVSDNYGHTLAFYGAAAFVYLLLSLAATLALTQLDRRLAVPGFDTR
ncbi:amino acid ABC transporter permease [Salinisphaera aquimarina]|uniref:Amino acid ABC transporter permease n=1 Tax=Salinisphaera aquimarina TaxID=2094031 RepID=A0ABV7EM01_9GAMM